MFHRTARGALRPPPSGRSARPPGFPALPGPRLWACRSCPPHRREQTPRSGPPLSSRLPAPKRCRLPYQRRPCPERSKFSCQDPPAPFCCRPPHRCRSRSPRRRPECTPGLSRRRSAARSGGTCRSARSGPGVCGGVCGCSAPGSPGPKSSAPRCTRPPSRRRSRSARQTPAPNCGCSRASSGSQEPCSHLPHQRHGLPGRTG